MKQRTKSSVGMGPGAASLILIFVMLSMSVLAMLSLMNSRNDLRLSDRSAEVAQNIYGLNDKAELAFAEISQILAVSRRESIDDDAYLEAVEKALPEEMSLSGREIEWIIEEEQHMLDLAVTILPYEEGGAEWSRHSLQTQSGDMFDDW